MTLVWSYGGGTQTAAIAVLIKQGRLPMPDIIVMADTSREVTATWDYLNNVIRPAGFNVQVASHNLATVDLYAETGDMLLPAFTRQSGRIGKMPTFCSNEWKARVVKRYLRSVGVKDCDVWIGMSTDEQERMKASGLHWYRHVYPLVEIVPMNKIQCRQLVIDYGWPEPPKSRCWMCPNMSPWSWREEKRTAPGDFAKAVALEKGIRSVDPDVYLHELGIPLEEAVEQSERQSDMFDGCDSGYCWT